MGAAALRLPEPDVRPKQVSTRVTVDTFNRLLRAARRRGLSRSDYLLALIEADLAASSRRARCRSCRLGATVRVLPSPAGPAAGEPRDPHTSRKETPTRATCALARGGPDPATS